MVLFFGTQLPQESYLQCPHTIAEKVYHLFKKKKEMELDSIRLRPIFQGFQIYFSRGSTWCHQSFFLDPDKLYGQIFAGLHSSLLIKSTQLDNHYL